MNTLTKHLEDFLYHQQVVRHLHLSTLRTYRYELRAAAADPRFNIPLEAISSTLLEVWITRQPVAKSTLQRRLATFRSFFAWTVRQGVCITNPALLVDAPAYVRRLPRPLRQTDENLRLDQAIYRLDQPYRLIFWILRETGMRVGEVLKLRRGDVCLDAGRESLQVQEAKNERAHTVILTPSATPKSLRALRGYLKTISDQPFTLLFLSNRRTALSYDAVHYQWAKLGRLAGLLDAQGKPLYTIHQLRHTRATELLAQGNPVEIVQRVLGHRDIRSTLGYAELNDQQVRAALEKPSRH